MERLHSKSYTQTQTPTAPSDIANKKNRRHVLPERKTSTMPLFSNAQIQRISLNRLHDFFSPPPNRNSNKVESVARILIEVSNDVAPSPKKNTPAATVQRENRVDVEKDFGEYATSTCEKESISVLETTKATHFPKATNDYSFQITTSTSEMNKYIAKYMSKTDRVNRTIPHTDSYNGSKIRAQIVSSAINENNAFDELRYHNHPVGRSVGIVNMQQQLVGYAFGGMGDDDANDG